MIDDNEMVMRSVYLWPAQDSELRQLAHELNVTKSDLIRSAIGVKLREWLEAGDPQAVKRDLEVGRRDASAARTGRTRSDRSALARREAAERTSKNETASVKRTKPENRKVQHSQAASESIQKVMAEA